MASDGPWSSSLVCQFVAELMGRTMDIADDRAHQRAVQAFVDEIKPWMPPVEGPVRSESRLFERMELDEQNDMISVVFTPEGQACFRGWLRRQGLDPMMSMS